MTAIEALSALMALASTSQQRLSTAQLLYLKKLIANELNSIDANANQLKAMKVERTELTIRIAELEEELAEAKKPRRRKRKSTNSGV